MQKRENISPSSHYDMTSRRQALGECIESPRTQTLVISLILLNALTIGLDADGNLHLVFGTYFAWIDNIILGIFAIEIAIKIFAFRLNFFRHNWNVFDFAVVCISLMPALGVFAILRTLRIIRILRLLKQVPRLRMMVEALISSLPSIGWVVVLLMLVFYIFAVIGTNLFGKAFPNWFGSIGKSLYTLFQVMTLESWSMGISRPVMLKFPHAYLFFIPFILMATYTALNIVIAVIVNAMNKIYQEEHPEAAQHLARTQFLLNDNYLLEQKLEKIEQDMTEIKQILRQLQQPHSPTPPVEDYEQHTA